jgi:hypothetical protein
MTNNIDITQQILFPVQSSDSNMHKEMVLKLPEAHCIIVKDVENCRVSAQTSMTPDSNTPDIRHFRNGKMVAAFDNKQ